MRQFTYVDDDFLISAIAESNRIALVCPGVTLSVARAIEQAMRGGAVANIVLDADPEIFRMGYGELEGLLLLEQAMLLQGASIMKCEGLRIGLLITDRMTVCFSPVPLLVEGGSSRAEKPNGVFLDAATGSAIEESVAADIGGNRLTSDDVLSAVSDIHQRPVLNFDISRTERVYQSFFRYVEFEVHNYMLQTKRISIPPDLMPIDQPYLREHVASVLRPYEDRSFFEVQMTSTERFKDRLPTLSGLMSPAIIDHLRRNIRDHFLIELPKFGTFITTATIAEFELTVELFQNIVNDYGMLIQERLVDVRDRIRGELMTAILPHIRSSPPARWAKYRTGASLSELQCEEQLGREIHSLLTSLPVRYEPKISVIYKDLTYATIQQDGFREALIERFGPDATKRFFPEHTASPGTDTGDSQTSVADPA